MTPRQFEDGFSTDYHAIQSFLEARGYGLRKTANHCNIRKPGSNRWSGRTKWAAVIDLVDDLRASEGLTTIMVREAA